MMNARYVVRIESKGALTFDRSDRIVSYLTDEELALLESAGRKEKDIEKLPEKIRSFFKPGSYKPDFVIRDPLASRKFGKSESFLSAPNRLYLELTRECKLGCKMCYNAAGKVLPNELSTAQIKDLLDEMERIGVFEARFTGGEPTSRKDFFEILDYAIAKGFYVSLATNAVWEPEFIEKICRRKIDDVIISLDGPEEINDRFRKGGSFKKTLFAIQSLKKAGIKKVRINTVLSKMNWRNVEPLFRICRDYNLLLIDFIHPRPFGRGSSEEAKKMTLTAGETLEFNRSVADLRLKYPEVKVVMDFDLLSSEEPMRHPIVPRIKACPAGREFAFVSPQGYVYPCGVAPVHDIGLMDAKEKRIFIAGNVLEKSILEIWHRSAVWGPFRDLSKCKPPKCHACGFWGKRCFGTCPVGAYYDSGKLDGEDPYCYSHLIQE